MRIPLLRRDTKKNLPSSKGRHLAKGAEGVGAIANAMRADVRKERGREREMERKREGEKKRDNRPYRSYEDDLSIINQMPRNDSRYLAFAISFQ